MKKIRVLIFTGNRAEYGLQYPILCALRDDPRFEYSLLVSGAHVDDDFGHTIDEIKNDGFEIANIVNVNLESDNLVGTTKFIGSTIVGISEVLEQNNPDFFIVYADRFEGFAALVAATQMAIPTAHIEGGDVTNGGALDDSVRHAMTKLAHLHFTTNDEASARIVKMGEEPWRVHNVGFPLIDLIAAGNFARPSEVSQNFFLDLKRPIVLFTQHSIATEFLSAEEQLKPSLEALFQVVTEGFQVIATFPNNDAGGSSIAHSLQAHEISSQEDFRVYPSLGRYFFHGLLNVCGQQSRGVFLGNSSSGIKETPAFGCPAIDVGRRQSGRLRAKNVVEVEYDTKEIYKAIKFAIEDDEFRALCSNCENPYGNGQVGQKILEVLSSTNRDLRLIQKQMTY